MAGQVLNFMVFSPLKLPSGLTGKYHAICHYSYNLPLPASLNEPQYNEENRDLIMIRLTLIIGFLISMILFTLFIMNLGYKQGYPELLYLGLGLPLWFYILIFYAKWLNRIEVEQEYFKIKNLIFGQTIINYKDIKQWEVIHTIRISQQNLLIRVKGKKLVISNMSDSENYETLRRKLRTNWAELEK